MTSTATEVTQTQSLAAIRNFIRVAVSCVTYLRGLCNDESYQPRQFLGLQLKQLIRSSPEADTISRWMEDGAFDALNKGYLKELALCIYSPDCAELLESYCFNISYSRDGQRASMTFTSNSQKCGEAVCSTVGTSRQKKIRRTRQEVQQALVGIITKLMELVESLPPLLCERVLAMRLTYHEDITPPSYEPPCFAPASQRLVELHRQEQQFSNSVAALDTGHHVMSITIRHPFFEKVRSQFVGGNTKATTETWESTATASNSSNAHRRRFGVVGEDEEGTHTLGSHHLTMDELTQRDSALCVDDVAFLVFTAFVLTKSPALHRGVVSMGEIEEYLRVACPFDVTQAEVHRMMSRLEANRLVDPIAGREEWGVRDPTTAFVRFLLHQSQVAPLLSPLVRKEFDRFLTSHPSTIHTSTVNNKDSNTTTDCATAGNGKIRVSMAGCGRKRPRQQSGVLGS